MTGNSNFEIPTKWNIILPKSKSFFLLVENHITKNCSQLLFLIVSIKIQSIII